MRVKFRNLDILGFRCKILKLFVHYQKFLDGTEFKMEGKMICEIRVEKKSSKIKAVNLSKLFVCNSFLESNNKLRPFILSALYFNLRIMPFENFLHKT